MMPTSNIVAVLAMSLRHSHPSFETIGRGVSQDGAVIGLLAPLAVCHQRRHAGDPVGWSKGTKYRCVQGNSRLW
jgi:hypothetical protein